MWINSSFQLLVYIIMAYVIIELVFCRIISRQTHALLSKSIVYPFLVFICWLWVLGWHLQASLLKNLSTKCSRANFVICMATTFLLPQLGIMEPSRPQQDNFLQLGLWKPGIWYNWSLSVNCGLILDIPQRTNSNVLMKIPLLSMMMHRLGLWWIESVANMRVQILRIWPVVLSLISPVMTKSRSYLMRLIFNVIQLFVTVT